MRNITIGTRKSKLALIQTNWVIDELKKNHESTQFTIQEIDTKGDQNLQVSLAKFGGQGVFLQELEEQLQKGDIDMAVHSLKDMPVDLPEGLEIACIPKRADFRDAYIAKDDVPFEELPKGAVIGTSSVRRAAQILSMRPDLTTKWIRGPIDSRIAQLQSGDFDAIILAVAGLKRLGIHRETITEYLSDDYFVPAPGQGALAIECRADDTEMKMLLEAIHDEDTYKAITAERLFVDTFEDGEQAPIGACAYVINDVIHLKGMVISLDGKTVLRYKGKGTEPQAVAKEVAQQLIDQGALDVIRQANEELAYDNLATQ